MQGRSQPVACFEKVKHIIPSSPTLEKNKVGSTLAGRSVMVMFCRSAYVLFNHDRSPSLKVVHGFLNEVRAGYCGRYGDWGYMSTDEAQEWERAAEMTLSRL